MLVSKDPPVLPQGEFLHPSVLQDVVVDDPWRRCPPPRRISLAGGIGRQDVVDVVDAAEGQLDGDGAVDGQVPRPRSSAVAV